MFQSSLIDQFFYCDFSEQENPAAFPLVFEFSSLAAYGKPQIRRAVERQLPCVGFDDVPANGNPTAANYLLPTPAPFGNFSGGLKQPMLPPFPMMMMQSTTTSTDANHYKFNGKELDDETGLYNYGARYYSPALGRYVTPDWSARPVPIPYADLSNPQTLNLYTYGKNNPTSLRDSDGHCVADDCKGVGVTVKVDTAPHIITNAKMPDNKYYSGVGGTLSIQITNGKGAPAAGISVTEQNTKGTGQLKESPTSVTTSANGTIGDVVMKAGSSSTPVDFTPGKDPQGRTVENLTQYLTTTPITDTSTQSLTFSTTNANGQPCNCQATYDRTLTNTDANGNLNTQNNSQGVNFNITTTKPVVTPAPAPEKKQPQ